MQWGSAGTAPGGFAAYDQAHVTWEDDGTVTLRTASHNHGQSHETTFAQIAADALGVHLDDVTIVEGDTGAIPYGFGTLASRSIVLAGNALVALGAGVALRPLRAGGAGREIDAQRLARYADGTEDTFTTAGGTITYLPFSISYPFRSSPR